jgi:hypothetical protein
MGVARVVRGKERSSCGGSATRPRLVATIVALGALEIWPALGSVRQEQTL